MFSGKLFFKFSINTLFFILALMLVMFISRVLFILNIGIFNGAIGNSFETADLFKAIFNGARYDGRIVAAAAIGYIVIYAALFKTSKRWTFLTVFASICAFITIFLTICNVAYYRIYEDTFNSIILGLIYDDRQAIIQTGMSGDYNIIARTLIVIFATTAFVFLYRKGLQKINSINVNGVIPAVLLTLGTVYAIALLMSSTLNLIGGSIDYLITPSKNQFLRKASPGALRDIYVVYSNFRNLQGSKFENLSGGATPIEAAQIYFGNISDKSPIDINALMKKSVVYGSPEKIKHIFVIIGESLSQWHFDKEFESIGLTAGLSEIATMPEGKKVPVFIQNAEGTIGTIDVMLTGLYNTFVPISDMTGRIKPFQSSCKIFKELGYKNTFYYFGSPTWRKLDRYVLTQGFDNILSVADMDTAKRGVWGAYDNVGFDFVLKQAIEHKDEPTFNMILTTSYHPPYDVPVKNFNAPIEAITKLLDTLYPKDIRHKDMNPNIMAHAWYADKAISEFVKRVSAELPDSLIIITGDHFDRIHPSQKRSLLTRSTIPLIAYGKNVDKAVLTGTTGAHIDIVPTILELTAPKGFQYSSFGRPLMSLDKNAKLDENYITLGYDAIASQRFIAENDNSEYFNDSKPEKEDEEIIKNELTRLRMGQALSWQIIFKGYQIEQ